MGTTQRKTARSGAADTTRPKRIKVTQNREAPAYQEYAASIMAKTEYRLMSLSARGLLMSMRFECWENRQLPSNPNQLAQLLHFDAAEVEGLLPSVMSFFKVVKGHIICPELADYRKYIDHIHDSKSEGGKRGAEITNSRKRDNGEASDDAPYPSANPSPIPSGEGRGFRPVKTSQDQSSQNQPIRKDVDDPWIADYEAAECTADAYAKASGG